MRILEPAVRPFVDIEEVNKSFHIDPSLRSSLNQISQEAKWLTYCTRLRNETVRRLTFPKSPETRYKEFGTYRAIGLVRMGLFRVRKNVCACAYCFAQFGLIKREDIYDNVAVAHTLASPDCPMVNKDKANPQVTTWDEWAKPCSMVRAIQRIGEERLFRYVGLTLEEQERKREEEYTIGRIVQAYE